MNVAFEPITSAGRALHENAAHQPQLSADKLRPYIGIVDLRGGLHVGFDEGAWITTSFGVGQMLIGVACPYLGAIFGVRPVLLFGMILLFVASLLGPLSPNLNAFLAAQFLAGVGSGTFIPLSIGFIVRSLPTKLAIYGVAIYAMNLELSQNIAASLEGWYADNWSWRGIGFSLLYASLDQGNRLDWTSSGLVNGLLISGSLVTLAIIVREFFADKPFLNIRVLVREGIIPILLLLAGFRFIILSTAYIIPTYLQVVQNYREMQVGAVLLWIALPQLLIVFPLGWLLSRVDARLVLTLGASLICAACLMATNLTADWATDDFLPSQILQALGRSFALTALIVRAVRSAARLGRHSCRHSCAFANRSIPT